jgi:hypothetical protein
VPRRTFLPFDWANGSRDLNADGAEMFVSAAACARS